MSTPIMLETVDDFATAHLGEWRQHSCSWADWSEDMVLVHRGGRDPFYYPNGEDPIVAPAGTYGVAILWRPCPFVRCCDYLSIWMQRRGQPGSWFPLKAFAFTPTIGRELDKDFTTAEDSQKGCVDHD